MAEKIEIGDYNFVTIQGWMRNELDLSGTSLVIYAIIYGFSQANNQWCSASQRYLEEWSGASLKTVKRTLNDLVENGLIKKRYFTNETGKWCEYKAVVPESIKEGSKLPKGQYDTYTKGQNVQTKGQNDTTLRVNLSSYTIKNNIEDNIDNNIEDEMPARTSKKRFIKPTIEEIKAYCIERRNTVNAERFFDYYECNGWKVGKNPMKDWKAAVRTWENNGYSNNSTVNNQTCGINNTKSYAGGWD